MIVCAAACSVGARVRASGPGYNARVEQALRAAGFGKEAPRPGGGAGQLASAVTSRAQIARQGEEETHVSLNYRAVAEGRQAGTNGEADRAERKREAARRRPLQNIKLSMRSGHRVRRAILSTMERRVAEPRKTDEHHRPSRGLRHTAGLRRRWPRHVELERVRGRACGK